MGRAVALGKQASPGEANSGEGWGSLEYAELEERLAVEGDKNRMEDIRYSWRWISRPRKTTRAMSREREVKIASLSLFKDQTSAPATSFQAPIAAMPDREASPRTVLRGIAV